MRRYGRAIRDMVYVVEMPDGSRWGVPVAAIALHRARKFADEFDGNVARALEEAVWPSFEADIFEIRHWALVQMEWADVAEQAQEIRDPSCLVDYQAGWANGAWVFREPEECPGWKVIP